MGYFAPIENKKATNRFLYGTHSNLLVLGATFAGVVLGILLSVALMRPMAHSQVAAVTKNLDSQNQSQQALAMKPANFASPPYLACAAQTSGRTSGAQTAAASSPSKPTKPNKPQVAPPHNNNSNPGRGGDHGGGGKTVVIKKIIGGLRTKTIASNKNTGYGSTNTITTTNENRLEISNDNDISITNNNPQTATSGKVVSNQNTTAGQATSGTASNSSKTSFNISVSNGAGAN